MNRWVLILLLCIPLLVDAQSVVQPPLKSDIPEEDTVEELIQKEKDALKASGIYEKMRKYVKIRMGETRSGEMALAEGACGEINNDDAKDMCTALHAKQCNTLKGWKRDMCDAFGRGDLRRIKKIMSSSEYRRSRGIWQSLEVVSDALAMYGAFSRRNIVDCERYTRGARLRAKVACRIFLSVDPLKKVDELLTDIARHNIAKRKKDADVCDVIIDVDIKKACQNSSVKRFEDIW